MRDSFVRGLHVLALGLWFGGAGFFNFVTAPSIFESFKEVVNTAPSDRTAHWPIAPRGGSEAATKKREDLANALAGSAVGPVFPKYFAMQAVCGLVASMCSTSLPSSSPFGLMRCPRTNFGPGSCLRGSN